MICEHRGQTGTRSHHPTRRLVLDLMSIVDVVITDEPSSTMTDENTMLLGRTSGRFTLDLSATGCPWDSASVPVDTFVRQSLLRSRLAHIPCCCTADNVSTYAIHDVKQSWSTAVTGNWENAVDSNSDWHYLTPPPEYLIDSSVTGLGCARSLDVVSRVLWWFCLRVTITQQMFIFQ